MENQFDYSLSELTINAKLFHSSVCESGLVLRQYVKSHVRKPKAANIAYGYANDLYNVSVLVHDWAVSAQQIMRDSLGEEEIRHLKSLFDKMEEISSKTDYMMYQLPDAPAKAHKNFQERKDFLYEMIVSLDEISSIQQNSVKAD